MTNSPAIELRGARLAYGERILWDELDLIVEPGEFVAVLGPNGTGKTSLLRVLLGEVQLCHGDALTGGRPVHRGNPRVGYIPQQQTFSLDAPLRARDLVGLGYDGHHWGMGLRGRRRRREAIDEALRQVDATDFADRTVGQLSGGEQQRTRVAQALAGDPSVLLCDEPLASLDLANQQRVSRLIDRRRHSHGTAVLFVTHEINPVLPYADRVVYIVDGRFRIGSTDEVMTSEVLTGLYGVPVDVLRVRDRIVVVGTGDSLDASTGAHGGMPA